MDNESLASVIKTPQEAVKIIADSMIKVRPRGEVVYRPYKKSEIYRDLPIVGPRRVNLKKLYPDAKPGNVVYISTILESCADSEAKINIVGNAKIFFCGDVIFDTEEKPSPERRYSCPVFLHVGENPVTFMVRCESEDEFEFSFMPSVKFYWEWVKYYLLHVRATSPIKGFRHEDGIGISRLYETEQPFDGEYAYPKQESYGNRIDFLGIFPEETGECAYALTYAAGNTELTVSTSCENRIFVNGEPRGNNMSLKKGDMVLVKLLRGTDWHFEFNKDADIVIPFLESSRVDGYKWLTLGTFGHGRCIEQKFAPEYEIQFKKPYITADWKRTFWKLAGVDDYMRPYMDTRFFGQWFYAFMVGSYGLLKASEALDCNEYKDYFIDSTRITVEYFDYMHYEFEAFGQPTFLEHSVKLPNLDSIGSIGRNICEFYKITSSSAALYCIEELAKAAKENIPRFSDGTYKRITDMWADDTFMSCPFLARVGKLKNDTYYYEEVIRQLLGFKKRLWIEEEKIFSHIFFLDTEKANKVPWGRGNGWIFVTLSDVLSYIPEDTEGRNKLLELYREFAEGIAALQDEDGLWHQVLNRRDSYSETSCTGMFMLGMCRGVKNGWLPECYRKNIMRAYNGLILNKIDSSGKVYDVCMGSSNSPDVEYYIRLGTVDNDDHGTGVILSALSAYIDLEKSE